MSFERRAKRLEREFGRSDGITIATAAEFWTGGSPLCAEAYDRKGAKIEAFALSGEETFTTLPIPTKPPVCNGMIAPRDSWMMPPPCNEMIPPGAPRLLA